MFRYALCLLFNYLQLGDVSIPYFGISIHSIFIYQVELRHSKYNEQMSLQDKLNQPICSSEKSQDEHYKNIFILMPKRYSLILRCQFHMTHFDFRFIWSPLTILTKFLMKCHHNQVNRKGSVTAVIHIDYVNNVLFFHLTLKCMVFSILSSFHYRLKQTVDSIWFTCQINRNPFEYEGKPKIQSCHTRKYRRFRCFGLRGRNLKISTNMSRIWKHKEHIRPA